MAKSSGSSDSNLMGALAYVPFASVLMLLSKKDDSYVLFHAKQGLVLSLIMVVLWMIPFLGWILQALVALGFVLGFVQALSGKKWKMPLIGDVADKINL